MAKKTEETTTTENTTIPGTKFPSLIKAKGITSVVDSWHGKSPSQISEEYKIDPKDIIHVDFLDLLDHEIVVVGFSERTGEKSPFIIILALLIESDELITTACGGMVVIKKLTLAAQKKALPVQGKINMPSGKNYYDFTS